MSHLRRIVLVRHGETEGQSSTRFHGSSDVPLSDEGRAQVRAAAAALRGQVFDLVVASPLARSWESARILAAGVPVRLIDGFREVDFGRWEGLTSQEIQSRDPVLHEDWQNGRPGFEYPGGERRADFRARVEQGLAELQASGARSVLGALHKGVIRTLAEALGIEGIPAGEPQLGGSLVLSRAGEGPWFQGIRSSDPAALAALG